MNQRRSVILLKKDLLNFSLVCKSWKSVTQEYFSKGVSDNDATSPCQRSTERLQKIYKGKSRYKLFKLFLKNILVLFNTETK